MDVLDLLLRSARLKWVTRSGWQMRGVPDSESVADHSWGVAWLALVLADLADEPLDRGRLLALALTHDLAEVTLSDIPGPALRYLPAEVKQQAEERTLSDLLAPLAGRDDLLSGWREFETAASPEGRLVRDADRLDMLIQAFLYETAQGTRLDEFWDDQGDFSFAVAQDLYQALRARRDAWLED
jgi:putative hydrolase of HD superfamily